MMLGLSFTTQRKLAKLGDVPKQRIKLEGEAKAHLVEFPGPTSTFHVDLQEFLIMRFLWSSGSVLYEGGFEGGQPQGQGKVFLEDGTLWYEGEFWGGTMSGQGALYRDDGSILYQGEFSGGLISDGQEYYPDGAVKYQGKFADGAYSGGASYGVIPRPARAVIRPSIPSRVGWSVAIAERSLRESSGARISSSGCASIE